jgi:hypothetical protein
MSGITIHVVQQQTSKERYTMLKDRLINSADYRDKIVKKVRRQTLNEFSDLEPAVNGAAWYPKNGTLKVRVLIK